MTPGVSALLDLAQKQRQRGALPAAQSRPGCSRRRARESKFPTRHKNPECLLWSRADFRQCPAHVR